MSDFTSPLIIRKIKIKNRIGFAPINTGLLSSNGKCHPAAIPFFQQYADGGVGLIYIGGVAVNHDGKANASSLVLKKNKTAAIERIIALSKKNDVKIAIQVEHAGRQADPKAVTNLWAPSPIACPVVKKIPKELSANDIDKIVQDYRRTAEIASEIGCDFFEIHAAHGYLLSEFISPATNKRNDCYGGTLSNRFRIIYEIIDTISNKTEISIGIRINCTDNIKDGITIEDVIEGLKPIEHKLSYISVSAGMYSADILSPFVRHAKLRVVKNGGYDVKT